nr:unnamed protein product [Spirometra erinaceieuropaei]
MEHRVGAVVTRLCLTHRWSAGWWWNVASTSSRRGSAWYVVDQPVGWISELAPSTRAHLVHRRRPQACGNVTDRVSPLTLAAWNVRSLLDNPRSNRPERRTALVARELARYIAALSETRFSEQGQLEEVGAGYTFFWSGRSRAERRDAGVAFAIRTDIVGRLPLKQGCVLAPTLFSLMFSAMLMDAYRDERPGIRIAYRTDGHLLNRPRMNFQSRVSTTTVHELLFADDCTLNTT